MSTGHCRLLPLAFVRFTDVNACAVVYYWLERRYLQYMKLPLGTGQGDY